MAVVYWIHTPDQENIVTEGYVGVCCRTANHRFNQHRSLAGRGSTYPIHCAIRKYGDSLVVDTVIEGSSEYCYELENKLRPASQIGWNIAIGGKAPIGAKHTQAVKDAARLRRLGKKASEETRAKLSEMRTGEGNSFFGKTHSEETKSKISEARKNFSDEEKLRLAQVKSMLGKKHTDEAKAKISASLKLKGWKGRTSTTPPWNTGRACKNTWAFCGDIYDALHTGSASKWSQILKLFPISKQSAITITKKIIDGWNPREDEQWLLFKSSWST